MKLNPTLWRTCRALASETRLQLLWLIFEHGKLSVNELADQIGMSPSNTSNQLRALSARGLIFPHREKMKVYYRAEANDSLDAAPVLLNALKDCRDCDVSFKTVIRQMTACTHARRIEIIQALTGGKKASHELMEQTGMSASALSRHLDKLERRGFVKYRRGDYRRSVPGNPLGRTLLKLAGQCPAEDE